MILIKIPIAITCQKIRLKFGKPRRKLQIMLFPPQKHGWVKVPPPPWAILKPRYLSIKKSVPYVTRVEGEQLGAMLSL